MHQLRAFYKRVGAIFRRTHRDADLEDELRVHLDMLVEENISRGMAPAEARRAARLSLGGQDQIKEAVRDQRGLPFLESLVQDVRFALRMLRKNPGFTAAAVLTLALAIGVTTGIFTVVYGTLLRTLPFPEPSRLVQLSEIYQGHKEDMSVTASQLRRLHDFDRPFAAIAGFTNVHFNVAGSAGAEHVRAMPVSADFLRVLALHPEAGRDFAPEEDTGAGTQVALASHALAVRHFGSAQAAIGQTILLDGNPYTVIGVMPPQFPEAANILDGGTLFDLWIPLARVARTVGSGENIDVVARLRPGATWPEVSAATELAKVDFHKEFPGDAGESEHMAFLPLAELVGADLHSYLFTLFGATGFVLLIACANISNLLLARGSSRSREVAVRMALGASRGRLIRQLLTESTVIAVAGGALGFLLAAWTIPLLVAVTPTGSALDPTGIPRIHDIRVDGIILVFAVVISLLTGALFGIVPAFSAGNADLTLDLKEGSVSAGTGRRRARLRQGLVAAEFALSLVLLTGAGLMIATCARLLGTNPGFDPHHVLTLEFWLDGSSYDTTPKVAAFYDEIERKVSAIPGVQSAGIVGAGLPLERGGNEPVRIPGQTVRFAPNYREASPGYFRAMGMPLLQGRGILDSDTADSNHVVVINEAFIRNFLKGPNPIGVHVYVADVPYEVVGVVADAKSNLDQVARPAVFVPSAQTTYGVSALFEGWFPRHLAVRTSGDPLALSRAVRDAFRSVDSSIPIGATVSMDQMMSRSVALRSFIMFLLSLFAGLALILAAIGIYGVISYSVSQRTREIGIRIALGAHPSAILSMMLAQGLKLVVAGAAVGLIAAFMLVKLLQDLLFGVTMRDPLIFLLAAAVLVAVSLAACLIPARRAMRVDPVSAMRYE